MLLLADLEALERALQALDAQALDANDPAHTGITLAADDWQRVERLSRHLRQPWLRTTDTCELEEMPVELAAGRVGGQPVALYATADGQVGLLDIRGDGLARDEHFALDGLQTDTDEIRNILLSPRRYSTEVDVFVCVRRWANDAKPPSPHLWRASLWWDAPNHRHRLRPIAEHRETSERGQGWTEVPLPDLAGHSDDILIRAFEIQVQNSGPDALADRAPPPEAAGARLLALCRTASSLDPPHSPQSSDQTGSARATGWAWLEEDDRVCWWPAGRGKPSEFRSSAPPVAMALAETGSDLLLASGNGLLLRYRGGVATSADETPTVEPLSPPHQLDAGVSGLALLPAPADVPDRLDILVAGRNRRLSRWRWLGTERLERVWDQIVSRCLAQWPQAEQWRAWADPDSRLAGPEPEVRQLLWLHATWRQPERLLDGYCQLAHQRSRVRPGTLAGQELAALLAAASELRAAEPQGTEPQGTESQGTESQVGQARARAAAIQAAGGIALREQLSRSPEVWRQTSDALFRSAIDSVWDRAGSESGSESESESRPERAAVRAAAIGNLATRPYLHEATWPGRMRLVSALSLADGAALVLATGEGLGWLPLPESVLSGPGATIARTVRENRSPFWPIEPACHGSTASTQPWPLPWTWIRSLHQGADRPAVAVAGREAVVLIWPSRGPTDHVHSLIVPSGQTGLESLAVVPLSPPTDTRLHLGLVWADGTRVWLDPYRLELAADPATALAPDGPRQPLPVPARALDVTELEGQCWMAAGTRLSSLHWLSWSQADGWQAQAQTRLDAPVVALRFAIGEIGGQAAPVLIVSTQAGRIWCFDARTHRVLWIDHLRGSVTTLDVTGRGAALRIGISATPNSLKVLDVQGRRTWLHEMTNWVADMVIVPETDGQPEATMRVYDHIDLSRFPGPARIALVGNDGSLSIFRRSERQHWQAQAAELPESEQDSDRLRVARLLARRAFDRADEVMGPEARRALLAEAIALGESPDYLWQVLDGSRCGPADLAAMARELRSERSLADWQSLWGVGLDLLEDLEPPHAGDPGEAMLAELLAALRRRRVSSEFVSERLADLRQRPRSEIDQALAVYPTAAIQAAHAWLQALVAELGPADLASRLPEALLRGLHRLPAEVVRHLPLFLSGYLPEPGSGRVPLVEWLLALAGLACDLGKDPDGKIDSARLPDSGRESGRSLDRDSACLAGLHALRGLVAAPEWRSALAVLARSRAIPAGEGPLLALLREPAARTPPDSPDDTWRLERQQRWLLQALARPWQPRLDGGGAWPDWSALARRMMTEIEPAWRRALLGRLTEVVARSRARLERAEVLAWTGARVRIRFVLLHEGGQDLEAVSLRLQARSASADGGPTGPVLAEWRQELSRFEANDPPVNGRLEVEVPPGVARLVLQVSTESRQGQDSSDWPLDLGEPFASDRQTSPALIAPQAADLFERIDRLTGGVAILVLDEPLRPEAVVRALVERPDSDRVDLDRPLHDYGPGRRHGQGLDLDALLRAIDGQPVENRGRTYRSGAWPRSDGRPGRVLLSPAGDLAERLLTDDPAITPVRAALWAGLRQRAQAGTRPAWVWVLPAATAAIWHAALAAAGAVLLHPAMVDPRRVDGPFLAALAGHLGQDRHSAGRALAAAGHDLRQLGLGTLARTTARLAWARADLRGLQPRELAALIGLSQARIRLSLARIPMGAVADETVESRPVRPGRSTKLLAKAGEAGFRPERLMSLRKDLRVRGLTSATDLADLAAPVRRLLHLVGFDQALLDRLERLHLVQRSAGLYVLRPDLAGLIAGLVDQQPELAELIDVLHRLADPDAWWRALHLPALVGIQADEIGLFGLPTENWRRDLFWTVGRLWADGQIEPATGNALAQALTGTSAAAIVPEAGGLRIRLQRPDGLSDKTAEVYLHLRPVGAERLDALAGQGDSVPTPTAASNPRVRDLHIGCGPGLAGLTAAVEVRLDEPRLRDILRSRDPVRAFWAGVRAQTDLDRLSPFVQAGSLPPGSPLFVGREAIRAEIAAGLGGRSFLILGARQIGKTSLLNQVLHEARSRDDVHCVMIDCQGSDTAEAFVDLLAAALAADAGPSGSETATRVSAGDPIARVEQVLDRFEQAARRAGRRPVLLINEIDGLVLHQPSLLLRLRARHDAGRMRFVFTGYAVVRWALDDPEGPMYHFTVGGGGRYFVLGILAESECRHLLAWLTRAPLSLEWADLDQRERGEHLLVQAAYRVPWVLQDLCQRLVLRMNQQGRAMLTLEDVRQVLVGRAGFLQELERFDLAVAMGRAAWKATGVGDSRRDAAENQARIGGRLILLLLVWHQYQDHPDPDSLRGVDPASLAFTEAEAGAICRSAVDALGLLPAEQARLEDWLAAVPLGRFLEALSLSLILSPAVIDGQPAWCFQNHIYPSELLRADLAGASLEDRLLDQAQHLLRLLASGSTDRGDGGSMPAGVGEPAVAHSTPTEPGSRTQGPQDE